MCVMEDPWNVPWCLAVFLPCRKTLSSSTQLSHKARLVLHGKDCVCSEKAGVYVNVTVYNQTVSVSDRPGILAETLERL